jgi:hypothetical protein
MGFVVNKGALEQVSLKSSLGFPCQYHYIAILNSFVYHQGMNSDPVSGCSSIET